MISNIAAWSIAHQQSNRDGEYHIRENRSSQLLDSTFELSKLTGKAFMLLYLALQGLGPFKANGLLGTLQSYIMLHAL